VDVRGRNWIEKALEDHEVSLMRYASSILGDVERARDVVQDTFLRLCRESPAAVGDHLAPWLFRVCRNRAIDLLRREGRMQLSTVDTIEPADPGPLPSAVVEQTETLRIVNQVLMSLSANQREVIRLKFQEGLSYKEISEITGLSVSNVGFLIHVGVKKLRQSIQTTLPRPLRRVK
jgi:RNA polymerase sigma-70 factor (ECF subfamily)